MFAPGAIACAISTSSEISPPQPTLNRGSVEPPVWLTIVSEGGGARAGHRGVEQAVVADDEIAAEGSLRDVEQVRQRQVDH